MPDPNLPNGAAAGAAGTPAVLARLHEGDVLDVLRPLRAEGAVFDICLTSPPYFQKFDYGKPGQLGIEDTVGAYVAKQAEVFAAVRDLMPEGSTLFIIVGDTSNNISPVRSLAQRKGRNGEWLFRRRLQDGFRQKEALSVPFELARALRADGWIHRTTLIWDKGGGSVVPNSDCAPESHEYILHMIKWSARGRPYGNTRPLKRSVLSHRPATHRRHGCVFPESLAAELLSACPPRCSVIDPYVGSGTVRRAALKSGRSFLGIDLDIGLASEARAAVPDACLAAVR